MVPFAPEASRSLLFTMVRAGPFSEGFSDRASLWCLLHRRPLEPCLLRWIVKVAIGRASMTLLRRLPPCIPDFYLPKSPGTCRWAFLCYDFLACALNFYEYYLVIVLDVSFVLIQKLGSLFRWSFFACGCLVAACGCLWLLVAACGCLWLLVAACGCLWLPVGVCGCLRLPVAACGCL